MADRRALPGTCRGHGGHSDADLRPARSSHRRLNRHDSTQLIPLVDRVPPVRGKVGRPRRRPDRVCADRGYDYEDRRRELRRRGITPEIARRKTEHGSGLGRHRWVVERTFAWLHQFKRLLVRYDRRADIHEAFLAIGCCIVCYRRLRNTSL